MLQLYDNFNIIFCSDIQSSDFGEYRVIVERFGLYSETTLTISNQENLEDFLSSETSYYVSIIIAVSVMSVIVIVVIACIFVRFKRSYLTF